jgi:hypothetical protein
MKIVNMKWQALLGLVVTVWMGGVVNGRAETPPALQMYPQIVRLSYVEGDVRLSRGQAGEKATHEEWEKAAVDVPIYSGFTLVTGAGGRAEIELEDASRVYLDENSVLSFPELSANVTTRHTGLDLVSGVMTIDAETPSPGSMIAVNTPANGFWIRSPWKAFMRVNSYLDGMELTPMVDHTKINTPGGLSNSNAGQTMVFQAGQKIPMLEVKTGPSVYAAWDDWVHARAASHMEAMNAAMKDAGLTTPVPGLTEIAAQGSFFDCAPYGKCWEPKEGWDPGGAGDGSGAEAGPPAAEAAVTHAAAAAQTVGGQAAMPVSQNCSIANRLQCIEQDDYFPCSPYAMRDFYGRDPATGRLKLIFSDATVGLNSYYRQSYLWGVCHTGSWVHWHKRYVWVAGTHRHHHWGGVHWVKTKGKTGFVPAHPHDVTGKPPLNIKHGVYVAVSKRDGDGGGKKERGAELVHVSEPVKLLNGTPKEFAKLTFEPLPRSEAPHMEARQLHGGGERHGDAASKPAMISFDHKSGSFQVARTVMQDGHEHQISEPVGGRGNGMAINNPSRGGESFGGRGGSQSGGFNGGSGNRSGSGSGGGFSGGGGSRGGFSGGGAGEGAHSSAPSSGGGSSGASSGASSGGAGGGAHH